MAAKKRPRGRPKYTDEQRKAASERMLRINALAKLDDSLNVKKEHPIKDLRLGLLIETLTKLRDAGIPADARVQFISSCTEGPEIVCQKTFDGKKNLVDYVIIR